MAAPGAEPRSAQSAAGAASVAPTSGGRRFASERDSSAERERASLDQELLSIKGRLESTDRKILAALEENGSKTSEKLLEYLRRRQKLYKNAAANTRDRRRAQRRRLSYYAILGMRYDALLEMIESVAHAIHISLDAELEVFDVYEALSENEVALVAVLSRQQKELVVSKRGEREFLTLDIGSEKKVGKQPQRRLVSDGDVDALDDLRCRREELFEELDGLDDDGRKLAREQSLLRGRMRGTGCVIEALREYYYEIAKGDERLASAGEVSKVPSVME